ncbi:MAG TPA: hypothetical protein VEI97_01665, partial [bacterium]|nr:hypothetical protein [bacterium]
NNQGTGQTFRFTYTVEVPIQATFTDIHITDAPEPVAFEAVQLGTKLAVAYRTGDEVRVARATKAVPTGPADWVEHKVDDADGGGVPGVVATPERLYVAYFRQRRMVVATSIGQEPSSAADYGVGIVQAGETGSGMAMLIRGTTPYVGYVDGGGRAMMGPATGLIGNEWTIAVDPGGEGLRVAQDAQGLWAAWFNRTRGEVVVARQRNGQWSHHRIAGAAEGVALQRVRDRLYLLTGEGSAGQMRVLISKGPDPQSAEDYTELLLVGRNFAGPASLGVVEGRLAFALMDPAGRMNIARSLKVTPLHSSDFAFVALDPGDEASVLQLNERVVFVYSGLDQKSLTAELGSGSW